jgi:hypothetical protein
LPSAPKLLFRIDDDLDSDKQWKMMLELELQLFQQCLLCLLVEFWVQGMDALVMFPQLNAFSSCLEECVSL